MEAPIHHTPELDKNMRFNESRIKSMVDSLEGKEIIRTDRPYAIGVIEGSDPVADIARSVEYPVFEEAFGNDYELMEKEYKPYDEDSVFLVAVDVQNKKPFGTIRFIKNGEQGLKTVNDIEDPAGPWAKNMPALIEAYLQNKESVFSEDHRFFVGERTLDLGTLAVAKEYRKDKGLSGLASACLYRAAGVFSLNRGYRDWVTIIDQKPYELIQAAFDNALETIPGLDGASYLDSPVSFPAYFNVEAFFERMEKTNPNMSAFLADADVVTTDFSFKM